MEELKIEYVPLSDITPYARNAKRHPQEQIEQIKESIRQFGFNDPLALWHGEIVEGHGRYFAAQELGLETVPIIRLDGLTDEQRRAYALVHNKLTMNSGFDFDALKLELDALDAEFDMTDFGFELEDYEYPQSEDGTTPPSYDNGFKEEQEPLSPEELKAYSENEDDYLIKRRVIITYLPEQEDALIQLLGVTEDKLRVVYDFEELAGE